MKPQCLPFDIISTLPSHIIETILCLVTIKEATRTSILSKKWRYKWTKIPKLEFYDCMFKESSDDENQVSVLEQTIASGKKKMGTACKVFYVICQVLLMRQGPIHEFILSMDADKTCVEIDHILSYLLRNNALKKLTLQLNEEEGVYYWLPSSVFSFHHLTDLHLCCCNLNRKPTFSGFSRLTNLSLKDVYISTKSLLHIVSNCPLLKRFTLIIDEQLIDDVNSTITELFKCLPLIEHLSTSSAIRECFVIDSVPQERPALLIHLEYFSMDSMSFESPDDLRFLARLIHSSPNLEKIQLEIFAGPSNDQRASVLREAYSGIWLEHLEELDIYCFRNLNSYLEFLKCILVKSPKLKKVYLFFENVTDENEEMEMEMLDILAEPPPASPLIQFTVSCFGVRGRRCYTL